MILRETRGAGGYRFLGAHLTEAGDLVVEGQDLGSGVEDFWGPGLREYERFYTVRAQHLPLLVAELGGAPGEDLLQLLVRTCSSEDAGRLESLVAANGPVPAELWSRLGD
ncbi:hypothetical protein ABGB08_18230 [Acrocarpospora sp. B8E8]